MNPAGRAAAWVEKFPPWYASIAADNWLVSPAARSRATLLHNPLIMTADALPH
jgi:hypothetical protein